MCIAVHTVRLGPRTVRYSGILYLKAASTANCWSDSAIRKVASASEIGVLAGVTFSQSENSVWDLLSLWFLLLRNDLIILIVFHSQKPNGLMDYITSELSFVPCQYSTDD